MAAHVFILVADRLKSTNKVRAALKHNLRADDREIEAGGRIDPARVHLNRTLVGPATVNDAMALYKKLMADATPTQIRKDGKRAKLRDDAVLVVEMVLSIPLDAVADEGAFFGQSLEWIEQRYGVPILSATLHRDERGGPHLHVLLVPVKGGRMVGSRLIGKYGPMHDDFHRKVAAKHGLARGMNLDAKSRQVVAQGAMTALAADPSLMSTPEFRAVLHAAIERNPGPWMELLGLLPDRPPEKAWVEIMTRPVDEGSISCVRFRSAPPPTEEPVGHAADAIDGDNQGAGIGQAENASPGELVEHAVIREDDLPADTWDVDLGVHVLPPPPQPSARAQAMRDVQDALDARQRRRNARLRQIPALLDAGRPRAAPTAGRPAALADSSMTSARNTLGLARAARAGKADAHRMRRMIQSLATAGKLQVPDGAFQRRA